MRNLINRILVKLGLREPPPMYDPSYLEAYKPGALTEEFTKGYGRVKGDWIVRAEIVSSIEKE